jgi:pimeloyl-ACP methyl ester carboxylesterase
MQTVTSRDGTTIAFDRTGGGPPVVLVGGALGDRGAAAPLAALLAARVTAISYDRRGRGDSGDVQPYSVDREIDDLAALIDAAGGEASVFGHSSGAALALEAAHRGLPIRSLAVYEPPFLVDPGHGRVAPDYRARLERAIAEGRPGDAVEQFMREAVLVPPDMIAGMKQSPMWPGLEAAAHTLVYDQDVMDRTPVDVPEPLARFRSIQVPVLALEGGASPDWLRAPAKVLGEMLPNGRHRTLDGQTHGFDPAVMAPVLVDFFTAAPVRAG